jgi:hypothetical protein
MSKLKVIKNWAAWTIYDKIFNEEDGDWGIVADVLTNPTMVAVELTEEEADAYLKLLRS